MTQRRKINDASVVRNFVITDIRHHHRSTNSSSQNARDKLWCLQTLTAQVFQQLGHKLYPIGTSNFDFQQMAEIFLLFTQFVRTVRPTPFLSGRYQQSFPEGLGKAADM